MCKRLDLTTGGQFCLQKVVFVVSSRIEILDQYAVLLHSHTHLLCEDYKSTIKMNRKLTSESLFENGPIAQIIVWHLGTHEFMKCVKLCKAWNAALDRKFLWKQVFCQSLKPVVKTLINWAKYYGRKDYEELIIAKQSYWHGLSKKLSLPVLKLLVCQIDTFQKYNASQRLEHHMFKLLTEWEYPHMITCAARDAYAVDFFKFHLDILQCGRFFQIFFR